MSTETKYQPVTHLLTLERTESGWSEKSREYFGEVCKGLQPGLYEIGIKSKNPVYRSTRYKFYFGHVLTVILLTCGRHFQVYDDTTAEFRPATSTEQIHEAFKLRFNPAIIKTPHGTFTVPASTTGMTDSEFITKFEETIISEFSGPPFHCDFMSRQEYGQFMSNRNH